MAFVKPAEKPYRSTNFLLTAGAIALVFAIQIPLAVYRTRNAYFVTDDFLNFMIYRDMGLTWKYLFRDIFGHITPLYRLIQAIMCRVNGVHFAALRGLMIATALVPTAFLILIGNRLKVPLQISTASGILLAALPQISQSEFWWSNGLLVLPGLAAVFICIWLLIGKSADGPSHLESVIAATIFTIGLGFYDKDLFAPALFLGVLTSLRLTGRGWFYAAYRAFYDLRYIVLVSIIWAITLAVLRDPSPPAPTLAVSAHFMWLAWSEAAIAGMLGIGGPGLNVGGAVLSVLAAQAILAAAVGWTILRGGAVNKRALAIWAGIMIYTGVTITLTARMRAGVFGADLGRLLRYAVEPAAFIVIGGVMGLAGQRVSRPWLPACAILVIAINVMIVSDVPLLGDPIGTRTYVQNVRKSYANASGAKNVVILDGTVPDNIMPPWMSPWNVKSKFLPLLGLTQYLIAGPAVATWAINADGEMQKR